MPVFVERGHLNIWICVNFVHLQTKWSGGRGLSSPAIKHAAIVSIVRYKLYDTMAMQHRSLGLLKVDSTLPLLETGGDNYNSSGNWPQIFIPFPGIH